MRSCVYCKRRYKRNSETSFHRFPKDLEERQVWLQNMKITKWIPKKSDHLCSLHFTDECFNKHFNRTSLKPGSIPTIFEGTFPSSPRPSMTTSSPQPSKCSSSLGLSMSLHSPSITKSSCIGTISTEGKIFSIPNITELSVETERDQEQVTHHDHDLLSKSMSLPSPSTAKLTSIGSISAERKIFCDANITALSVNTERGQEQVTTYYDYEVSSSPKKGRIEFGLLHDHSYPRSSKKVAQQKLSSIKFSKAKIRALNKHVQTLKLQVANMKSVINDLTNKNKVSEECQREIFNP